MLNRARRINSEFDFFLRLYIFFNVVCAIYFSYTGFLGGDFANDYPASPFWLVVALVVVLTTFYFFSCSLFKLFSSVKVTRYSQVNSVIIDLILTSIFIYSIYVTIFYKIGVYGLDPDELELVPGYLKQIYSVIQPIHFGIIYLFYRIGNYRFLTYINLVLYVALFLASGQTNQFILIFALYLFYRNNYAKPINMNMLVLLTMIGIAFYPFFRLLKIGIVGFQRDNTDLIQFATLISSDFLSYYTTFLFVTLERFQIVANISFLLEHFQEIYHTYSLSIGGGYIFNFFTTNWIIKFIMKSVGLYIDADASVSPQTFLALLINGRDFWASHIGVFGYYIFYGISSVFIYLFIIAIMFVTIILCKKMSINNNLLLLSRLLVLIIICHGWLMAFVFFLQALFLFYCLIYIVRGLNKSQVSPHRMLEDV
ncbi:oligosaccharide repeat unit polymerase [Citrobacter telavivensis]